MRRRIRRGMSLLKAERGGEGGFGTEDRPQAMTTQIAIAIAIARIYWSIYYPRDKAV